jgi:hypothetical protein
MERISSYNASNLGEVFFNRILERKEEELHGIEEKRLLRVTKG